MVLATLAFLAFTTGSTLLAAGLAGSSEPPAAPPPPSLPDYDALPALTGSVRSLGSSTATNLLERIAGPFGRLYPQVRIEFETGGSSAAIPALIAGRSEIAPMSRAATAAEKAAFAERFGYPITEVRIAVDAIGFFVHPKNPVEALSLEQLRLIFGDRPEVEEPRTWGELGVEGPLAQREIVRMISLPTQGSHGVIRSDLLKGGRYHLDAVQAVVASELVQAVTVDPAAIGFVPLVFRTPRAKMIAVIDDGGEARLPTPEACVRGEYPFARFLYVYLDVAPGGGVSPPVERFLRFVLARQGQNIVQREGFTPLPAAMAAQELAALRPAARR